VWSVSAESVTCWFEGRDHPLAHDGEAFVGLFGVHRMGALGPLPLRFTLVDGAGRRAVRNDPADTIQVVDGEYPVRNLVVNQSTMSLLDPAKMNQEDAFLNGVFGKWTPEKRWTGAFLAPVGAARISSGFGVRRSINGGPATWAHEGTDYAARVGEPIRASAEGTVVFAGPLYVRGNVVVVDHGWGVMTGYFHMSQILAEQGQGVEQGDVIGLLGDTGFATGPHLHVEVRVRNQFVEPLEWFA
jgi:murein DD-endopeptidase MepM/ murein hydrolase activator NlpD